LSSKKDKLLEAAQKFILKGQIDKAIKEYVHVVELDPGDMRHRQKLAELYVRVNRKDEAIGEYEAVGNYYEHNNYYLKAISVFKQIQKLDPANIPVCLQLAGLNRKQGLTGNALAEYERICAYYEKNGMYTEILRTLEQIVDIEPENTDVLLKLAETRFSHGSATKAYDEFSRIAQLLLTRGDDRAFAGLCSRVIGMFPENTGFVLDVVSALVKSGNPAPVVPVLRDITVRERDNRDAWQLFAEALRATNAGGELQSALQNMILIFPDDPAPREWLIEAALAAGDIEGSIALLEQHRPALAAQGDSDALERLYIRILESCPVDTRLLRGLKNVYEALGKQDKLAEITVRLDMQLQIENPDAFDSNDTDMVGDDFLADIPDELEITLPEPRRQLPGSVAESDVDGDTSPLAIGDDQPEVSIASDRSQPEHAVISGEPTEIDIELDFSLDGLDDMAGYSGGADDDWPESGTIPDDPGLEFDPDGAVGTEAMTTDLPDLPGETPSWGQANDAGFSFSEEDSLPDGDAGFLETIPEGLFEFIDSEADITPATVFPAAANVIDEDDEHFEFLVSGVRKGLDEQLDKEDTETHYNLGIAFREMGLFDDAITEFRAAAADPGRRIDCFALQGLCYRDKGDFRRAEDILKRGLDSASATAAELSPIKYELAELYDLDGRHDESVRLYREIQAVSPGFRDTAVKLGAAHGEVHDDLDLLELDAEVD
jgi:tetratricopeptide (TPR) repeat protein